MSHDAHPGETEEKRDSNYEQTHLRGKPFIVGAIGFAVFFLAAFGVVRTLVQDWSFGTVPPHHASLPPSADPRWNTEAPQVQIDPALDLAKVRQTEERRLHTLRWNDAAHTSATIPIEEALKLMSDAATKGELGSLLPSPKPATPLELQVQKSGEARSTQTPNP